MSPLTDRSKAREYRGNTTRLDTTDLSLYEPTCPYCGTIIHFRESSVPYRAMTGQYDIYGDKCSHFIGLSRPRGHSSMQVAFHSMGKRIYKR